MNAVLVLFLAVVLGIALPYPAAFTADAMNTPYGAEPYLTDDVFFLTNPNFYATHWGKFLAALVLLALILVIFYWKPRRFKPGSYRFYPSHRTNRRPHSGFRR